MADVFNELRFTRAASASVSFLQCYADDVAAVPIADDDAKCCVALVTRTLHEAAFMAAQLRRDRRFRQHRRHLEGSIIRRGDDGNALLLFPHLTGLVEAALSFWSGTGIMH